MSHLVGQVVKLRELNDRAIDRSRINKIRETARRHFLDGIKSSGGAVALKRANVARQARLIESTGNVLQ